MEATSGLIKSVAINLKQAGSSGLLEPSDRPAILRDLSQPFVDFEKRYWMSALNMDRHRRAEDDSCSADRLQVLPDNYVWLLVYFSCYGCLSPLDLEAEVVRIEMYLNSLQPGFFGKEVHARADQSKRRQS